MAQDIEALIQGDVSGQIAVGTDIRQTTFQLQVTQHGGVLNVLPASEHPGARRREGPRDLPPRPSVGLLDRVAEAGAAAEALRSREPVDVYGQPGIGKTSLLRHLAHQRYEDCFPDGVVYIAVRNESADDVLQSIFEAFYETDGRYKPGWTGITRAFQDIRALIVLDDVDLDREEAQKLLDAVPKCSVLVSSQSRLLWGEGRALGLPGLPEEDALTLIERELGRTLTPQERTGARALAGALERHPLRILQAASLAREQNISFAELADRIRSGTSPDAVVAEGLATRSDDERGVLAVLAALNGGTIGAEQLGELMGLPDAAAVVETLSQQHLTQEEDQRVGISLNLPEVVRDTLDLASAANRVLSHFTSYTRGRATQPERLLEEDDGVLQALSLAESVGRYAEVLGIGGPLEAALALAGRWGAWQRVLRSMLAAARAIGDREAEARCLHQLGTRALCLAGLEAARDFLSQALAIREAIGDATGAAITQNNLDLVTVALGTPSKPSDATPRTAAVRSASPLLKGIGAAACVVAVVAVVAFVFNRPPSGGGPTTRNAVQEEPTEPSVIGGPPEGEGTEPGEGSGSASGGEGPAPAPLQARLEPEERDFGRVLVGLTTERSVSVTYEGRSSLSKTDFDIAGPQKSRFAVLDIEDTNQPKGQATVTVQFAPESEGNHTAELTVVDNVSKVGDKVSLSGFGSRTLDTPEPQPPWSRGDRKIGLSERVVLAWSRVAGAGDVTYRVRLQARNPQNGEWVTIYEEPGVRGTSLDVTNSTEVTVWYQWSVDARDERDNRSEPTDWYRFVRTRTSSDSRGVASGGHTAPTPLGKPRLVSPGAAPGQPPEPAPRGDFQLLWRPVPGAARYRVTVQYRPTEREAWKTIVSRETTAPQCNVPRSRGIGWYQWGVVALGGDGSEGPQSEWYQLVVTDPQ